MSEVITSPALCEPFINGRDAGRLLHDLGLMLSLLKPEILEYPVLDFGAGSCWITEAFARMGQKVTAFDIHGGLEGCISGRIDADKRIDSTLISHAHGDGHAMPFDSATFGHLLCYDTLHHMHDYDQVFREFFRVLKPGGRAIFIEPGAQHSKSAETIAFMKLKSREPDWIERDVVLEDINQHAVSAGFAHLRIVPAQHPAALSIFSLTQWQSFRRGNFRLRWSFSRALAKINYDQRVIFYCDKAY